jgi:succinyl-diaminopimelate desuccinylase
VQARLSALGFVIERHDRAGVKNLWARRGVVTPLVCFAGHVDVVPPGPIDQWTSDPFTPTERDGFLVGRGVADMKGPVAAMVTAIERVVATKPQHAGSIALLLTSDEEGAGRDGTKAVVEALVARGERITACLLGEPTSDVLLGDTIKNGRRGSLNGRLVVHGVQAHVAYPERGKNPIHAIAPALAELTSTVWDRGNAYFPPTSFQVSNMTAGTGADNVIPGSLELWFNFRFSTEWRDEDLRARVAEVLARHGVDHTLTWHLSGVPFVTPPGQLVDAVRAAILDITGVRAGLSTGGGTSDGRYLSAISDEIVEFGPLNDTIHKIDERLAVEDLAPLSRIYERVLRVIIGA